MIDAALRHAGPTPRWRRGDNGVESLQVSLEEPVAITTSRGRPSATRTVQLRRQAGVIVGVDILPERGARAVPTLRAAYEAVRGREAYSESAIPGEGGRTEYAITFAGVAGHRGYRRAVDIANAIRSEGSVMVVERNEAPSGAALEVSTIRLNQPVRMTVQGREVSLRWANVHVGRLEDGSRIHFVQLHSDLSSHVARDASARLDTIRRAQREAAAEASGSAPAEVSSSAD